MNLSKVYKFGTMIYDLGMSPEDKKLIAYDRDQRSTKRARDAVTKKLSTIRCRQIK